MFYKKEGKPESGELVLCTVKKILYHSVFVSLDEYQNIEGMVHISEIAPGRIRNLRDYVKEGKRIVCKVLKIDERSGNIDLSLRRVGTGLRIKKMNEYKQEEKAEKLLELSGKEVKLDIKQMYEKIGKKIVEEYGSLYSFFEDLVQDASLLNSFSAPDSLKKAVLKVIQEKVKIPEVKLDATLTLVSYREKGIEDIKNILKKIEDTSTHISYLGAPKYRIEITGKDYKSINSSLKDKCEFAMLAIKKINGYGSYEKKHHG